MSIHIRTSVRPVQSTSYWHCDCTCLTCWDPRPAVGFHTCGFKFTTVGSKFSPAPMSSIGRHNFDGMQHVIDPTSTISAPGLLLGGLLTGICWLVTTILPYRCLLTCTDTALPAGRAATLLVMSVYTYHCLRLCISTMPLTGLKHGYLARFLLCLEISASFPAGETRCIS